MRLVDFGFGDLDTNTAGEPPCTHWPRGIVTVELDRMNGEVSHQTLLLAFPVRGING
jgi:hypothetical protein